MSTTHVPGTSVVDNWERKRRRGLKTWNSGKRWLARAQPKPGVARYRTKAFAEQADAWTWAEEQVAKYRLGLDNGQRCTLRGLMEEYLENLAGKGAAPDWVKAARRQLTLLADAGINDLRDERLASKVEAFYRHMTVQMTNPPGCRFRGRRVRCVEVSAATKNRYMSHIMALCAYARRRRYIPYDPLYGIVDRFKESKRMKPTFSLDELRLLVRDELADERFWLPFVVSTYAGLRLGEALYLEWQDIRWSEKRIHIRLKPEHYRLKGQKERYAPLQSELADILRPLAQPHGWIAQAEARENRDTCRWFFRKLLRRCGIAMNGRSPHSCRHTWVSLCIASGMDSFEVMDYAGHASLNTTLRYARACGLYRDAVAGWPRGQFQLRTASPIPTTAQRPQEVTGDGRAIALRECPPLAEVPVLAGVPA
jgi:integrase